LSQRGGSVEVHIRFGKKIYSPFVKQSGADLVLSLEMQESLRAVNFASQKTAFLINKQIIPIPLEKQLTENEILSNLKKIAEKVEIIPAAEICEKNLGTNVVSGIYLLSLASFKRILPLKPNSILNSIKKIIPEKYLELNVKTFNLAKS
jgi:indolepyruvate ferredoxin oxidoreductase beta subunit